MINSVRIQPELETKLRDKLTHVARKGNLYAIRSPWPGVQLYYPPIKYLPREKRYENEPEAAERLEKYAANSEAHTIIFDLEDGCRQKSLSRDFLRSRLPHLRRSIPGRVAIRINALGTAECALDLKLIEHIARYIDDVMLAKAGEKRGVTELEELAEYLAPLNEDLRIQPIIEHPKSLKIADAIFGQKLVEHVVFGIHDFSRAMHIQIGPEKWQEELYPFMCTLTTEARLAGKGVIGGVETLLLDGEPPDMELISEWLPEDAEENARIIYEHARREAAMGYTGKQVIHPNHISLIRYGFGPRSEDIRRSLKILQEATRANAFLGGAIRFEDEMMDPPMFAKALQVLLRSLMLGNKDTVIAEIASGIVDSLPADKIPEIWPYPTL